MAVPGSGGGRGLRDNLRAARAAARPATDDGRPVVRGADREQRPARVAGQGSTRVTGSGDDALRRRRRRRSARARGHRAHGRAPHVPADRRRAVGVRQAGERRELVQRHHHVRRHYVCRARIARQARRADVARGHPPRAALRDHHRRDVRARARGRDPRGALPRRKRIGLARASCGGVPVKSSVPAGRRGRRADGGGDHTRASVRIRRCPLHAGQRRARGLGQRRSTACEPRSAATSRTSPSAKPYRGRSCRRWRQARAA